MVTKLGRLLVIRCDTWTGHSFHHFWCHVLIDILALISGCLLTQDFLGDVLGEEAIDGKGSILVLLGTRAHRFEGAHHFIRQFIRH
jgi:hypothetical protein